MPWAATIAGAQVEQLHRAAADIARPESLVLEHGALDRQARAAVVRRLDARLEEARCAGMAVAAAIGQADCDWISGLVAAGSFKEIAERPLAKRNACELGSFDGWRTGFQGCCPMPIICEGARKMEDVVRLRRWKAMALGAILLAGLYFLRPLYIYAGSPPAAVESRCDLEGQPGDPRAVPRPSGSGIVKVIQLTDLGEYRNRCQVTDALYELNWDRPVG